MILRLPAVVGLLSALTRVSADSAPEITTLAEGYNYIAKIPCIDCPLLYQDSSTGTWTERNDENAILLNISLPLSADHLTINSAPLITGTSNLPRIYAAQVPQSHPMSSTGTEDITPTTPLLGLSYGTSLHTVINSTALIFRFNIFGAYFPLTTPPTSFSLDNTRQKVLELIFLPRPLQSPADTGSGWEIISARLRAREPKGSKHAMKMMLFEEWDDFGKKGSPWHAVKSAEGGVVGYAGRGIWQASGVVLGVVVLFMGLVVVGVLWCEGRTGAFEKASEGHGSRGGRGKSQGSGSWADVEKAGSRLLSAGDVIKSGGSVVGVGKSD